MPELMIYEDIGEDWFGEGVTAKSVQAQLADFDGDLTIRVNSYGGDVFQGHAIYNLIKGYDKGEVTVFVDGIAASAASIIAMAGDKVLMPLNAMLMIHDPWTIAIGNSDELLKTAETLDQIKQTIVNVYKDKTGMEDEEISNMMTEETWLDADQAAEFGFAVKDEEHNATLNKLQAKQWINKTPEIEDQEPQEPKKEYPNNAARLRYLETQVETC
ncbi:MAG: Clp protease ClpP [Gammaproteobacteria bacterium]|nr:Clp protease ClpP [Gammaproteobacteria bacterium]